MEKNYLNPMGVFNFVFKKLLKSRFLTSLILCLCTTGIFAQNREQTSFIQSKSNLTQLQRLGTQYAQKATEEKSLAEAAAKKQGAATSMQLEDGSFAQLQQLSPDGKSFLYYRTYNEDAAISTRTNYLNTGSSLGLSLDGQGMTAHVWDGGHPRLTHQEYDGPGGENRVTIGDEESEGGLQLNFHAAHVTGTICASGVASGAQGMAPQSNVKAYMWTNDIAEATNQAAEGMLLSNHSYGYYTLLIPDQYFGAYIEKSREWDELMYNAPYYLMVVAAGNDGYTDYNQDPLDGNSLYDKLAGHGVSKNNLVVANANDAIIDGQGNLVSVSINSSSSQGPTDDYRIKPDITGNGTDVYSTYEYSDTAYESITGTSMASPNVTGSLLLLQQHYENLYSNFMRAATLKGIALHTADDAGISGPDPIFGWGLLNAKTAAETISQKNKESLVEELTLTNGDSYTFTVTSDGINPLMASISWTDPSGTATVETNSSTPVLVNDLDITVSDGTTTYQPYKLTGVASNGTGDNTVDPFERIDIPNASGSYTVTITHKGTLLNELQDYSLVITGVQVECELAVPTDIQTIDIGYEDASLNWSRITGASYEIRYRQIGSTQWTNKRVTSHYYTISELLDETTYEFQVKSICDEETVSEYSNSITFTTTEKELVYCDSQGNTVVDEYIGHVILEDIDNPSEAGNGYSDFTHISTDLQSGNTYTIEITPFWTGYNYNEGYAVWIDYNQNGSFEDEGELVWYKTPSTESPVYGTFTVPTTANKCATRMRVSMQYSGVPSSCGNFNFGEVEDYTVIIDADNEAPNTPSNLMASEITETSAIISWDPSNDNYKVDRYKVYWGNTLLGKTTQNELYINSLVPNTKYNLSVIAEDTCGNESDMSTINIITLSELACAATVSSFPYTEGFEGSFGHWYQPQTETSDWIINTSGTATHGTGPSVAFEGNHYIYAEASHNAGTADQTVLTSPCFDLSKLTSSAIFEFNYHMYGDYNIGSLSVEVSTDEGASWSSIWQQSGNQGDAWLQAKIDLSLYYNKKIKLRFHRLTNATERADIGIDNITVYELKSTCENVSKYDDTFYYTPGDLVLYNGHVFERTETKWVYLGACALERTPETDPEAPPFHDSLHSNRLQVFPVPTVDDQLYIQHPESGIHTYLIFDLTGQVIDQGEFVNRIHVGGLKAGIYILQVNNDAIRFVKG